MEKTTSKREVQISKALSYLLRHGAVKEKLSIDEAGFISLKQLLNHQRLKTYKPTFEEIKILVDNNDKKRFTLKNENDEWFICANQGHSIKTIAESHLKPLLAIEDFPPSVIHGTYSKTLPLILSSGGLSKMDRLHIHFARGLPEATRVISGMRASCNVIIYLNVTKCLEKGLKFYESANDVILSPGDEKGFIPTECFSKITKRDGSIIPF